MTQLITQELIDDFLIQPKIHKLYDGDSELFLAIEGDNLKWYINTTYKYIKIGGYPAMSLQQARTVYLAYLTDIRNEVTRKIQYELDKVKPTHIIDGQEYKQLELKE